MTLVVVARLKTSLELNKLIYCCDPGECKHASNNLFLAKKAKKHVYIIKYIISIPPSPEFSSAGWPDDLLQTMY